MSENRAVNDIDVTEIIDLDFLFFFLPLRMKHQYHVVLPGDVNWINLQLLRSFYLENKSKLDCMSSDVSITKMNHLAQYDEPPVQLHCLQS